MAGEGVWLTFWRIFVNISAFSTVLVFAALSLFDCNAGDVVVFPGDVLVANRLLRRLYILGDLLLFLSGAQVFLLL